MEEKTFEYTMKVQTEGPVSDTGVFRRAVANLPQVKGAEVTAYRVLPKPRKA